MWTVYVIVLPTLAAQAGIRKSTVVYILLVNQLVFFIVGSGWGRILMSAVAAAIAIVIAFAARSSYLDIMNSF